jgi:hypothetical protein
VSPANAVGWWSGHQFGIVPRGCVDAIVATAATVEQVSGPTAVAVFTALAIAADRSGSPAGGQAAAADMLAMSPGSVRRVVASVLVPAGVATREGRGSLLLHLPTDADEARRSARSEEASASLGAEKRVTRRGEARHSARTPYTDAPEREQTPPNPPTSQLALVPETPPAVSGSALDEGFSTFWSSFPRKAGKGDARKAWRQVRRAGTPVEAIVAGADRYARDPNRVDQFTKLPASWLRAECWDDPPLPARSGGRATARPGRADDAMLQRHRELLESDPFFAEGGAVAGR